MITLQELITRLGIPAKLDQRWAGPDLRSVTVLAPSGRITAVFEPGKLIDLLFHARGANHAVILDLWQERLDFVDKFPYLVGWWLLGANADVIKRELTRFIADRPYDVGNIDSVDDFMDALRHRVVDLFVEDIELVGELRSDVKNLMLVAFEE